MSSHNEPDDKLFENGDILNSLGNPLASPTAPSDPPLVDKPAEVEPAASLRDVLNSIGPKSDPAPMRSPAESTPAPKESEGTNWGLFGSAGAGIGLFVLAIVAKFVFKLMAGVSQHESSPPAPPYVPPPDAQMQAAFGKLFDPRSRTTAGTPKEPPIVARLWKPLPVGKSPFDRFRREDIPPRLRTADLPKQLVAIIEPDPKRSWATDLGVYSVSGHGEVLDARFLPPTFSDTRFLVVEDGLISCYDLGDDDDEELVAEIEGDYSLAKFSLNADRIFLSDGKTVRRVEFDNGPVRQYPLTALANPPSPYVQLELFDNDRYLTLRREDGHVIRASLNRYSVTEVTDLGERERVDDLSVSPDGRMLVTVLKAKKQVKMRERSGDGFEDKTLTLPIQPVRAVAHPSRKFLAVTDAEHSVYVMDLRTGKSIGSFQSRFPPERVEFTDDGRYLLHHDVSGKIYVFRYDQMIPVATAASRIGL